MRPDDVTTVRGLRTTHSSVVTEDQIDHLGHMNVRYYAVNAQAATAALLADVPGWGGGEHLLHDVYTRHHREQLVGVELEVRTAVLGADPSGLRLHHELRAVDTDELAATFVHRASPTSADGERGPVPDAVLAWAGDEAVSAPDHAAPRTVSLDLDLLGSAPTLEEARGEGLALRKPRRISGEECDAAGGLRTDLAPMLTWGGEPLDGPRGDALHETPEGQLMGWAAMENRVVLTRRPTKGTRIQAFGATVELLSKISHRLHWTYDLDAGDLLAAFETVSLAFDVRTRRSMPFPESIRRQEEAGLRPDYLPRPAP